MTRTITWLSISAALSLAVACGGRRIQGSSAEGTRGGSEASADTGTSGPGMTNTGASSDDDAPTTTDGNPVPPLDCPEYWTACPDESECVYLGGDPGNCGECDHACEGVGVTSRCSDYQCEPGLWPCIPRDQGVATCSEACASVGQTCASDAYCSGFVEVWLTDSANDNNPEDNLESCLIGFSGNSNFQIGCNDPIDWAYEVGGRTVVGVACCCTQD